jgi:hypothetical protein
VVLKHLLLLKSPTPSLGTQINWKQEKGLASQSQFCICVALWSEIFCYAAPWNQGWTGLIDNIFIRRDWNYLLGTVEPCRTDHPSKWGQLPIMMRLSHAAGVTTSWEPDCFPRVIIAVTTSPGPFMSKDWGTVHQANTCKWVYLTMHTSHTHPPILILCLFAA